MPSRCEVEWVGEPITRAWLYPGARPALTADGDGFLFVHPTILPDTCEHEPCALVVERISRDGHVSLSGGASGVAASAEIFAGTDDSGRGHWALSEDGPGPRGNELTWGSAEGERRSIMMDPERGLAAVAFSAAGPWLVTHEWESEPTVGEGRLRPIRARVERVRADGGLDVVPVSDPLGDFFTSAGLWLSPSGTWLTMTGMFTAGRVHVVGPHGSGALPTVHDPAYFRTYDAMTMEDGSLVIARSEAMAGLVRVVRLSPNGSTLAEVSLPSTATTLPSLSRGLDSDHVMVLHDDVDGRARVTALDESLAHIGGAEWPSSEPLAFWALLEIERASDGTWAVMVGAQQPSAGGGTSQLLEIRRMRACD